VLKFIVIFAGIALGWVYSGFLMSTIIFESMGYLYFYIIVWLSILSVSSFFYLKKKLLILKLILLFFLGIGLGFIAYSYSDYDQNRIIERLSTNNGLEKVSVLIIDKIKDSKDSKLYLVLLEKNNVKAYLYGVENDFLSGVVIECNLSILPKTEKRNFGDMDYAGYIASRGIRLRLMVSGYISVKEENTFSIYTIFPSLRQTLEKRIMKVIPDNTGNLLVAMILGNMDAVPDDIEKEFRITGVSHILSVSGLHVTYMSNFTVFILVFILPKKKAPVYAGVFTFLYVLLTGAQPPAMRSFLMSMSPRILRSIAPISLKKNADYVSATGIVMLLVNPYLIHDPGFLISYSCIFGMSYISGDIRECMERFTKGNFSKLVESFATSLAAWIGALPVVVWCFGSISFIGIIINLPIIPLAGIITITGILGIILSFFSEVLSTFVLKRSSFLMGIIVGIVKFSSQIGGVGIARPPLIIFAIVMAFLLIFIKRIWKHSGFKALSFGLSVILFFQLIFFIFPIFSLKIDILNVGQGDGILIKAPLGKNILIDGGSETEFFLPILKHIGVFGVDSVFITHMHADHYPGAIQAIEEYKPKHIYMTFAMKDTEIDKKIINIAKKYGGRIGYLIAGDFVNIGGVDFQVISPSQDELEEMNQVSQAEVDLNKTSLVMLMKYKEFNALLTGDTTIEEEEKYLKSITTEELDLIKVPHHGSAYSSGETLVKKKAKLAIISVGKNFYGHPSDKTINNYELAGTSILRTDKNCGIRVIITKDKMQIFTSN